MTKEEAEKFEAQKKAETYIAAIAAWLKASLRNEDYDFLLRMVKIKSMGIVPKFGLDRIQVLDQEFCAYLNARAAVKNIDPETILNPENVEISENGNVRVES